MSKRRTIPALVAATLGLGAAAAWADQPSQIDLQKQVEQLQSQVKDLQTQRATPAYTAKDVDATVDSVLHDANLRSQLLAESSGFTGGWMDDHFEIRSADGNYSMRPGIQFQFRTVTTYNDKVNGGDANTDNGFEVRRLRFILEGTAITKDLHYRLQWNTDRNSGNLVDEEAYVEYKFADNFSVKVGQYKEFIYHEQSVSAVRQMAVDRSLLNEVFLGGESYVQGVDLLWYNNTNLRADVAFTDGYNSRNTDFRDPPANNFDFGVHGRVEWLAMGSDFSGYNQFSSQGNKPGNDFLVIGAGGDWSQSGNNNEYLADVDAQWNSGPWGVYVAWVGRYNDNGGSGSSFDCGVLAQVSYLINPQWEVFGRYDYFHLDDNSPTAHGSENTFHEITAGVNYFLHGHHAKITVDVGWLPNGSPNNQTGVGVLANDGENEYYIRGQFSFYL